MSLILSELTFAATHQRQPAPKNLFQKPQSSFLAYFAGFAVKSSPLSISRHPAQTANHANPANIQAKPPLSDFGTQVSGFRLFIKFYRG